MDLGFVSNAVALRGDGVLPARPWFLIELDNPAYGSGVQVAPSTVVNYDALAAPLRQYFPEARWAAHGQEVAGYAVVERVLADETHVRVGFEDAIHLPDGRLARSNAELVRWAVVAAQEAGRTPATIEETRRITGMDLGTSST
jgi:3-keto-5-aminohexanoate cleavage enzyme